MPGLCLGTPYLRPCSPHPVCSNTRKKLRFVSSKAGQARLMQVSRAGPSAVLGAHPAPFAL